MRSTGCFVTRTLMCKDHEVATFTYDIVLNTIVGRIIKKGVRWAALGCLDKTQAMTSVGLSRWLSYRAVPATRKDVPAFVKALGKLRRHRGDREPQVGPQRPVVRHGQLALVRPSNMSQRGCHGTSPHPRRTVPAAARKASRAIRPRTQLARYE